MPALVCCYPDEAVRMPFIQDPAIDGFCRLCLSVDTHGNTANNHAGSDALKRLHYRERKWQEKEAKEDKFTGLLSLAASQPTSDSRSDFC
jgi:hypothetical protein